ncbi:hypothetical protein Droror1_Dr00002907 [Drosera rotundifolia]
MSKFHRKRNIYINIKQFTFQLNSFNINSKNKTQAIQAYVSHNIAKQFQLSIRTRRHFSLAICFSKRNARHVRTEVRFVPSSSQGYNKLFTTPSAKGSFIVRGVDSIQEQSKLSNILK